MNKRIDIAVKIRYFVSPFESDASSISIPCVNTSRHYVISTRSFFAFTRNGISFRRRQDDSCDIYEYVPRYGFHRDTVMNPALVGSGAERGKGRNVNSDKKAGGIFALERKMTRVQRCTTPAKESIFV